MATREPIQIVEIDIDYCSLTYATGSCAAILGTTGVRKCFNTFATCQDKTNFTKGTKTLRFVKNQSNLPKGLIAYPCLDSVSAFSSTVNIAGSNSKMAAFGRRASVTVSFYDFLDSDIYLDKYQQERISGAAQSSSVGYNPKDKGTFFGRLLARFPYYSGRALRVIDGWLDGGVLTVDQTRHFIITDFSGPDSNGKVSFDAADVLTLADDDKAVVPKASRGKIDTDLTALDNNQTFSLTPDGIGSEYAASGYATIGSELVSYTRVDDVITLTGRGLEGTTASTHAIGDSFQEAYYVKDMRVDDLIYDLLTTYASISTDFCPLVSKWEPEITRWMSSVRLDTVITKPTGVKQLIGELADLGLSIWWDEVSQEIGLMANHPVQEVDITNITDRDNIKSISQEDNNDERYTQIWFYTKQSNPTTDYKTESNYDQINVIIDTEAEGENAYDDQKIKKVYCRWLNKGAAAVVRVLALRLLKRFNTAPKTIIAALDVKDRGLGLTDVVRISTYLLQDDVGESLPRLTQVYKIEETKKGHELKVYLQDYQYEGRFGYIMPNTTTSTYDTATDVEKATGIYLSDGDNTFYDGTTPYVFI